MIHYKFKSSVEWRSFPVEWISSTDFAALVAERHGFRRVYVLTKEDVLPPNSWVEVSSTALNGVALNEPTMITTSPAQQESYDIDVEFGPDVYSVHAPVPEQHSGIMGIVAALGEIGMVGENESWETQIFSFAGRIAANDQSVIRDIAAWKEHIRREAAQFEFGPGFFWAGMVRMAIVKLERAMNTV
jgi:hypothetical protein